VPSAGQLSWADALVAARPAVAASESLSSSRRFMAILLGVAKGKTGNSSGLLGK
jgi:hypothetical protein